MNGRETHGHSTIVNPWGKVLAEAPDEACFVAADVDPGLPETLRRDFPALSNRRL